MHFVVRLGNRLHVDVMNDSLQYRETMASGVLRLDAQADHASRQKQAAQSQRAVQVTKKQQSPE